MKYAFTFFLLSLALFSLANAGSNTMQHHRLPKDVYDTTTTAYLALGDSYTIGQSITIQGRFPAQTVALLKAKGIVLDNPEYIAQTGWTTSDLLEAIGNSHLKSRYKVVSLLAGVNDQYQGLDTNGYRKRFQQLLEKAIILTAGHTDHVFVLSIPDYSVTPFGGGSKKTQTEIDWFNKINKSLAIIYQVNYIDITPCSRNAAADQTYTANDGLHPSAKQYHEWALLLAAAIASVD